jgi:5-(carboxyamino)imidazole ribonucleotide synthase
MRVGVLGSGQLGRMLAHAGAPLGHTFIFFDTEAGEATRGIGRTITGSFSDKEALSAFAAMCDVVTYEFENVPCEAAHHIAGIIPVYPPPRALEVSQDRLIEKEFFTSLGIATPAFRAASTESELRAACHEVGFPCVVKTRRMGYDGKGQAVVRHENEVQSVWSLLGHAPLIVEGFVSFSRELSVIAARDQNGEIVTYPLAHNTHSKGILFRTEFPAPNVTPDLEREAHAIISRVLQELNYVGVLTIELFDAHGVLVANEMAPRVHNSGHITIDAAIASQFENHIRTVTGMPLGDPTPSARGIMYNLIGKLPPRDSIQASPTTKIHLYGKSERKGRKIGHINLLNPSEIDESTIAQVVQATNLL